MLVDISRILCDVVENSLSSENQPCMSEGESIEAAAASKLPWREAVADPEHREF